MSGGEDNDPVGKLPSPAETRLSRIEGQVEKLQRQGEEDAETREQQKRQLTYNRRLMVFTGLLFVTSVVSNIILYLQTSAVRRSADAARSAAATAADTLVSAKESFRQQVRPYVVVETVRINQMPTENVVVGIESVARNTGTTPAINLQISQHFDLQQRLPCSTPTHIFDENSPARDIGAGSRTAVRVFGERALTRKEAEEIDGKDRFICHFLLIRYADIFGDSHETEICSLYRPDLRGTGDENLFLWGCPGQPGRIE